MSIVNLGTQTINWKYKTSLKGSNLSRMFNGCMSPGIYLNNGSYIQANIGLITSYAGNQITINAFEAIFKASSTQTVHIGTSTAIALSTDGGLGYITESYPYITMSYSWADQIINYIDFAFKASGSITAYDLIIGKAIFTGGVVTSIDYSEASYPPYYNPTTQEYNVFGKIKLNGNRIDKEITTGIDANTTFSEFTSDADIYFSPSQDRSCDITAGAASVGTKLFLYHSGSGNYKETITYAVGKTLILTRKMFVELERVPGGWLFVRESRIGQLNEGLILPRGAVQLDGSLRTKDALWHYISEYYSALIVTNAVWLAGDCLKFVNYSETQYRIPDWRGIFSRNSGDNSVLKTDNKAAFSGGSAATVKLDSLQGHRMERNTAGASEVTARSAISTGLLAATNGYTAYNVTTTGDPVTDGVNGTPRIGNQTQPVSGSKIAYIFAED